MTAAVAAPPTPRRRSRRSTATVGLVVLVLALVPARAVRAELAPPPPPAVDVGPFAVAPSGLDAEAYVLVDATTGQVLLGRRGDERRPVASTIKVLTALSVVERLDPSDLVTVGTEVLGLEGASVGLAPGDRWTVRDLVAAIVVRSGNDAAEALAVATAGDRDAFVAAMRQDASRIGLTGVTITGPSGLDDGNLLSARDLATIARVALARDDLAPLFAARSVVLPGVGEVEARNLLLGSYAGANGLKTGFTAAAGNCLVASATRGDRTLIAVVLGAGDDPSRFRTAARLLDVGFDGFVADGLEAALDLVVAGGRWRVTTGPFAGLLVPVDRPWAVRFAVPVRPEGLDGTAVLEVDGRAVGELPVTVAAAHRPTTGLGAGVADGVHAALRAAVRVGALG